ncbi:FAD:protein FMN transferase [Thetidibacter halocola]|uniref:FAD:protein FMN transferase n=1 Tax=Thetidibacter halocola TaxID=2827239 RepID=A0A8J7WCW3_9RHOB|nr:FAD:protein FMN transferase [Thetidibacter halocola]MBS0122833.1 FAD:protein FMN transferase [Thetidibacter halocola]
MRRRRFLTLAAAFACAPRLAHANTWQGRALGAEVSVTLSGPREATETALAAIPARLEQVERLFSLYRADSALVRLNHRGRLTTPHPLFAALMDLADHAHRLSGGLFDPTVQPLWQALARGEDIDAAQRAIGWARVTSGGGITLGPGQALTLNGIAQGFATDLVTKDLRRQGFVRALVDIGEQVALGGPYRLGLVDPEYGLVGQRTLTAGAIATSSPGALRLGEATHILSPDGRPPLWSTISIEAPTATLADALSTAAVFMDEPALRALKSRAALHRITAVASNGDLLTL